jgi:aminomethyltransferase
MKHLNELVEREKLMTRVELFDDNGLIAVQGPKSPEVLKDVFTDVDFSQIPFMSYFKSKFDGDEYVITRSGYTGEDGFEIAGNGAQIVKITQRLLKNSTLQWAGLGSRDSLRLEAGLCLHGHDMTPDITPLEASLMWTVFKRKDDSKRLKFIGEDALKDLQDKVKSKEKTIKKRVGFIVEEPGIIRENC